MMLFKRKKKKKNETKEYLFKKEAYIPKKKLQKKERTVPVHPGKKGGEERDSGKGLGRKFLVLTLWILFWGEVVYVVFFAGFFMVNTIEIQRVGGTVHLQDEPLKNFLQEHWQGKWYGFVPKNNLLFIHSHVQEDRLLDRYPKLEKVEVHKRFPDTVKVVITEKPYQLVWCRHEECFLVNKEGKAEDARIFFQYPEEQGQVVRIQDTAEVPVHVGMYVLQPEDQQFVHDLITDFTLRTGLKIEGNLERPNVYSREMKVRTNKGFSIFFATALPVAQSLNHLMLVLQKEIPEDEWDKIDYVDLRTEKRVYYTRKDRAPEKTEEQIKREEEEEKKRKEEKKEE